VHRHPALIAEYLLMRRRVRPSGSAAHNIRLGALRGTRQSTSMSTLVQPMGRAQPAWQEDQARRRPGRQRRLPSQRERMFCQRLRAELPDARATSDCAGFSQAQAGEIVAAHLRRFDAAGRKMHPVFCTNDKMALGAPDSLLFSNGRYRGSRRGRDARRQATDRGGCGPTARDRRLGLLTRLPRQPSH
jgi:hypothetical protein